MLFRSLWLTRYTVDVCSKDQTGCNTWANRREAKTDQVECACHFLTFLSLLPHPNRALEWVNLLVLVCQRACDVERCQKGEYVRLETLHHELKKCENDANRK